MYLLAMDGSGDTIEAPYFGNPKVSVLLAIYWSQYAIALTFVGLRVYARYLSRAFGWDDAFILVAMVGFVGFIVSIGTILLSFSRVLTPPSLPL